MKLKKTISLKTFLMLISLFMTIFLLLNSLLITYISYETLKKSTGEIVDVILFQFLERHKKLILKGDHLNLKEKVGDMLRRSKVIVGVEIYDKDGNKIVDIKKKTNNKNDTKIKQRTIKNKNTSIGRGIFYIDVSTYNKLLKKLLFIVILIFLIFAFLLTLIIVSGNKVIHNEIEKLNKILKEKDSISIEDLKTKEFNIKELQDYVRKLKEDYETINYLKSEIERQNNLAMIGNFTASIIHDIKNPLSVILTYSELIKKISDDKKINEKAYKINSSAKRIKRLLDDILSFVKGKEIELEIKERYPLEIVNLALENLDAIIKEKRIKVEIDNRADSYKCMADGYRLSRALENIIKNAIEASEPGKKIKIKIFKNKENITFSIRDYAGGIPEEIKKKAFVPFVTEKKKSGTGLGLFIAKSIVEMHKGNIYFLDKADGTEFIIEIPAIE